METVRELYDRIGRITVRLRDSGMTLREVGEIMETSPENVRRRYLRTKIKERYDPGPLNELQMLERENRWAVFFDNPNRYDLPIEDLNLSERPRNCLKRCGVDTVLQLVAKGEDDLLAITNLGQRSLNEITERLRERGLGLRPAPWKQGNHHAPVVAPINWMKENVHVD